MKRTALRLRRSNPLRTIRATSSNRNVNAAAVMMSWQQRTLTSSSSSSSSSSFSAQPVPSGSGEELPLVSYDPDGEDDLDINSLRLMYKVFKYEGIILKELKMRNMDRLPLTFENIRRGATGELAAALSLSSWGRFSIDPEESDAFKKLEAIALKAEFSHARRIARSDIGLLALLCDANFGTGMDEDTRIAFARKYLELAVEDGDSWAMTMLAIVVTNTEPERAFRLLTRAAELGHASAINELAIRYTKGAAGCPRDPKKALELIRPLVNDGQMESLFMMADVLKLPEEEGVVHDKELSRHISDNMPAWLETPAIDMGSVRVRRKLMTIVIAVLSVQPIATVLTWVMDKF